MLIIGNLTPDGYLKDAARGSGRGGERHAGAGRGGAASGSRSSIRSASRARSLEECLLIQARHIGADDDVVVGMITKHLANLEKKNYQAIAQDLKQPVEEIYEAAKVIMDVRPASRGASTPPKSRTTSRPTSTSTRSATSTSSCQRRRPAQAEDLRLLPDRAGRRRQGARVHPGQAALAQWLIRSIQQRQRTIVKVTESILKFQREFFDKGIAHLKPLILRDVAEDIGMHESTVSRVTTNKYVHTPQGIFELKFFFNSGIARTDGDDLASEAVKLKIKQIIGRRARKSPHSDQRIVELLKDQNIDIARRTVAKYREQLRILSSSKRRQVF